MPASGATERSLVLYHSVFVGEVERPHLVGNADDARVHGGRLVPGWWRRRGGQKSRRRLRSCVFGALCRRMYPPIASRRMPVAARSRRPPSCWLA